MSPTGTDCAVSLRRILAGCNPRSATSPPGSASAAASWCPPAPSLACVGTRLWATCHPSTTNADNNTGPPPDSLNPRPTTGIQASLLKSCILVEEIPEGLARRAGVLRVLAGRGSAVDALVVATAEPGGTVLTGDVGDLRALADYADDVSVHRV